MPFARGQTYFPGPNCGSGLIYTRSVFPSKMTAFGFKQEGGAKGMAENHPWGMCSHLTLVILTSTCR
jgi:hypothetical protein